jgi:phage anti-repressor protein
MTNISFNQELAIALYESTENFPVDLDNAWQWLGYAKKQNAKDKLIRNFEDGIDFRVTQMRETKPDGSFSHRSEKIELTVDCFKSLGMMSGSEQGKTIRRYFLECERIAKQRSSQPMTTIQALAVIVNQMAEQERRIMEQEQQLKIAESRLAAVECEQGRYFAPNGNKYTVLGFAVKQGLELSAKTASQKGKQASTLCRKREIDIERIYDPRFGYVGLYPESILVEIFK